MALPCFQNIRLFVFCYGSLLLVDIWAVAYFRSALTTIERRFELPTTMVALIASSYQIGSLVVILFVSYYGSRWHRPRTLAIGSMLVALGYLTASIPQFAGDRYEYVDTMRNSSSALTKQVEMCDINQPEGNQTSVCEEDGKDAPKAKWYLFILIGNIMCGIGASSMQPLGMSYIDDFSHPRKTPVYIGAVMSMALIGPAFGFLMGAVIMRTWVDVGWVNPDDVTILPTNPSWVGAWWLGLLVTSSLIAATSIPFWFFPKKMKSSTAMDESGNMAQYPFNERDPTNEETMQRSDEHNEGAEGVGNHSDNIIRTFLRLAKNKQLLLLICAWVFGSISVVGVLTFFPKYLEVQFGISAAKANMLFGCSSVPCLVLGTMLGSYILKRTNMDALGITKLMLTAHILSFIVLLPVALMGCETIDVAGVTVPYSDSTDQRGGMLQPIDACNQDCHCEEGGFAPICGVDGVTYLTPCHAGCKGTYTDTPGTIKNYTECSCLNPTQQNPISHWSAPKRCQRSKCEKLVLLVMALKGLSNLVGGIAATPSYVLLLRIVRKRDKAFAIGLIFLTTRLGAWIPGPILYGKAIDFTCLYWGATSCGRGTCKVYDNVAYRRTFFGIYLSAEVIYLVIVFCLYVVTKRMTPTTKKEDGRGSDEKDALTDESLIQPSNTSIRVAARLASDCESDDSLELKRLNTQHRELLFKAEEALAAKETEILA